MLVFLVIVIICLGVKEFKIILDVIVFVNLFIVIFVIFVGVYYVNVYNWFILEKFVLYGWIGIFIVVFSCFYCFIGFDIILSVSEEVVNFKVFVLLVIFLFLGISLFVYIGVIVVLIMMVFYYQLKDFVFVVVVFVKCGFVVLMYIVFVGVLCVMLSSLLVVCFVILCLIYVVVYDGFIFGCFIKINKDRQVLL